MKMAHATALAVLSTLAFLVLFTPEAAQAQYLIQTGSDLCLGMSSNGTDVVTKACRAAFTVTPEFPTERPQVAVLKVTNPDGRTGCLDGWKGMSGGEGWLMVEACDGTKEQQWYLYDEGFIQNEANETCVDIAGASRGRNADLINFTCTWEWNQAFSWKPRSAIGGATSASIVATPNATAYLSPNGAGILSHNGGTVISNEGAGMTNQSADGHGGIVAAGAGNVQAHQGGNLVAAGAGNVLPTAGGNMTNQSADGHGGIVAAGAGNAVPTYGLQTLPEAPAGPSGPIITMIGTGRCVDVPYGSTVPGSELVLWDCNGQTNQQYTWTPNGELKVMGLCVDALSGLGNLGDKIGTWTCNGNNAQKWTLTAAGELRGINNRCIDVAYGDGNNGGKLVLWDCNGQNNQKWQVVRP